MQVVIVESPAKAKTINKYLGSDYEVIASYGHVRDLPPKDGSVRPDEDFAMDWEVASRSKKHLDAIVSAVKDSDGVILATDPDREGEAISWHVLEELARRKAITDKPVNRVTFNAITKSAVSEAMAQPRELDQELVDAYLARRALDYLVGFTLSPVLWRKLPGAKSAGRVQSVALRLIVEREQEVEAFVPREYWSVTTAFTTAKSENFTARLTHHRGEKLDKFDLADESAAKEAVAAIEAGNFKVESVEKKKKQRRPAAPFSTSTLQQEAARKLYFSAKQTMDVAQKLYEGIDLGGETVGLITYMRTDGVQMDGGAIAQVRNAISSEFGDNYVPDSPRMYKTKAKNAQEAHEAVRPTDPSRLPKDIAHRLTKDQAKLYELIWKRTVASQMEAAVLDQATVVLSSEDGQTKLRATGSVVVFDGFLKLYFEDTDDMNGDDEDSKRLPDLKEGEAPNRNDVTPEQHFTQPPPRYSEASLVKALEEKGIGRPSTYASIIQVLQDREYVRLDSRRFIPEDRGRVVTAFLESFFKRYVEYGFTADLEEQLDDISGGRRNWRDVLNEFWNDFLPATEKTHELRRAEVIDRVEEVLEPFLFPVPEDGSDPRKCPSCADGRLSLKVGKFGSFIGCSNYPDCKYTTPIGSDDKETDAQLANGPLELGNDPETGFIITLRKGPYGPYVQLADEEALLADMEAKGEKPKGKKKPKPKRASLPKTMNPGDVDLNRAIKLLGLPREVGMHPEKGEMIYAGIGRFGPYLKIGDAYKSLPADDDVLEVGINRAVDLLAQMPKRRAKTPAKALGDHPKNKKPVTLHDGRYGPYVQHGKLRATLPKDSKPEEVTLEQAVELLAAKAEKDKAKASKKAKAG